MATGETAAEKKRSFVSLPSCSLAAEFIRPAAWNEAGPALRLVFLHEGLGSIAQWRDFPERLCLMTGLPGVVYERRGYGSSGPAAERRTPHYLHEEAIDLLPQLMQKLAIERPVLIGHSDGGSIALIFASAFPGRVSAVITEAAHVFVEDITLEGIRRAVSAYRETGLREQLKRYHGDNTDAVFRAWSETWLSDEFRGWNIEAYLPGIKCPVLVIQGEDDEYGSAAQVEAIAGRVSGRAEPLVIPGCGHVPHLQAKEKVLQAMGRFALSCS